MQRLRDLGEHAWIRRWSARLARGRAARGGVLLGSGDDAAVVRGGRSLLLTTDTLVEGVHFRRGWASPAALGRRAFAVNASDVAAMGGRPRFALLALEAPGRIPVAELDALVAGFVTAARRAGTALVGGNVAAGPHLAVTVTLVGETRGRVVTRAGARAGDLLYLTGEVGAAGLAVARLRAGRRARLPEVPVRVIAAGRLARLAHAMIDVSDGVVQDAGHLCQASRVAAEIDLGRLPVAAACRRALGPRAAAFAATAGEDYELLVAVPRARAGRLARLGCRMTAIGRVLPGRPRVRLLDGGRPVRLRRSGFDHFR